jgi:hypothetical protein
MKRSTPQLPELQNMCRHYDLGIPCGIDGGPCVGHKTEVRAGGKKVKAAEYRHKEMVYDGLTESWIDGPWILCPKLEEALHGEPIVPDM